ncbi:hypothetical protein [Priestia megaterium]
MKKFDELPKNIKKTIRYIKQDASIEDLIRIQELINQTIEKRRKIVKFK